jgi:hypothetical protein
MNGVGRKDQRINGHAPTDHVRYTGHEMASIMGQNFVCCRRGGRRQPGATMKTLTSVGVFASPKRKRKTKDWFERANLVVAAARDRAVERAQQRSAPSMTRPPTVLQRRRLAERLSAKS